MESEPQQIAGLRNNSGVLEVNFGRWRLQLCAAARGPLRVGLYQGVRGDTDNNYPGDWLPAEAGFVAEQWSGAVNVETLSSVEIKKIVYGEGDQIEALWVVFEQRAKGSSGTLRGELRYHVDHEGISVNQPPGVYAGGQHVHVDGSVPFHLAGLVKDDDLAESKALTARWSVRSGPGSVEFLDASQPETTAVFSSPGRYVLQLTASDGVHTRSSQTELFVYRGEVTSSLKVTTRDVRTGTETFQIYDSRAGLYEVRSFPGYVKFAFRKLNATGPEFELTLQLPGRAPFARTTYPVPASRATMEINAKGYSPTDALGGFVIDQIVYDPEGNVIALSATFERIEAGQITMSGEVKFFANLPIPSVNQQPGATAGDDQRVTLDGALLSGFVADDGLPDAGGLTHVWTKVSGSGSVEFLDPHAASTKATFSEPGFYTLRLSASDGSLNRTDDVSIRVIDPALGTRFSISVPYFPDAQRSGLMVFKEIDGEFSAIRNSRGGVSVTFQQVGSAFSPPPWKLDFAAPQGVPLVPGRLYQATGSYIDGPADTPKLSVDALAVRLHEDGEFEVQEIVYGEGTEIKAFSATFRFGSVCGEIRFNPAAPYPSGRSDVFYAQGARIAIGKRGSFTAKIQLSEETVQIKGKFDIDGRWIGPVSGSLLNLAILRTGNHVNIKSYKVEYPNYDSFTLSRQWRAEKAEPRCAAAGDYTFIIAPGARSEAPRATGWGTLKVTQKGTAKLVAHLADGETVALKGQLSEHHRLEAGTEAYVIKDEYEKGWVEMDLSFLDEPRGALDAIGTLLWDQPLGSPYQGSIEQVAVAATRFEDLGPGREALSGSTTPVFARLTLRNDDEEVIISRRLRINPDNSIEILESGPETMSLQLDAGGTFSGMLIDPILGAPITISGAIVQRQKLGQGFWAQIVQENLPFTGQVTLELVPAGD